MSHNSVPKPPTSLNGAQDYMVNNPMGMFGTMGLFGGLAGLGGQMAAQSTDMPNPSFAGAQPTHADSTQAILNDQIRREQMLRNNQTMFTNMGGRGMTATASQHLLGGL